MEAIPFPPAFQELADRFQRAEFRDVFRSEKIVLDSPRNYAAALQICSSLVESPTINETDHCSRRKMRFNGRGQRIDEELPPCDEKVVNELRNRKLCNRHFLARCPGSKEECPHRHDGHLEDGEKLALMWVARMSPCSKGPNCRDVNCVAGHQCMAGAECCYLKNKKCRFELHTIDRTVVEVL